MKSKAPWIILVGLVALFCAFYFFFTEEFERHIWVGESKAAKRNPYLAAEQFLNKRDIDLVSDTERLDFSNISTSDVVILTDVDNMLVSQAQVDAALEWISHGGFLLVGVGQEIEGHASLLKEFDIEPEYQDVDIAEAFLDEDGNPMTASQRMQEINRKIEEREAEPESDAADTSEENKPFEVNQKDTLDAQLFDLLNLDFAHEFYTMPIAEPEDVLHIAVLDRIVLRHPWAYGEYKETMIHDYQLNFWVDDEHGERLLDFGYGEGRLVAMSSAELWTNSNIGLADHAYLLSHFLNTTSTAHVFFNIESPSILSLLNQYFYEAISASLLLLILWLWRRSFRVEQVLSHIEGQRRSFAEHLSASAKFLAANKQYQTLLEPLKEDIDRHLRPSYPNFDQLNKHAQIAILFEKTELPETLIEDWIGYCHTLNSHQDLLAALKIGHAIRNTL